MDNTTYYAQGTLSHNGKDYARGDRITDLTDAQAQYLLQSGTISTETPQVSSTVQPVAPAIEAEAPSSDVAKVGGETVKTGEPSLDGPESPATTLPKAIRGRKTAQDAQKTVPPAPTPEKEPEPEIEAPVADLSADL